MSHFRPSSPPKSPRLDERSSKGEETPKATLVSFDEEKIARQKKEALERKPALRSPEREKAGADPAPQRPGWLNRKQRRAAFMKQKRSKGGQTDPPREVRVPRQGSPPPTVAPRKVELK